VAPAREALRCRSGSATYDCIIGTCEFARCMQAVAGGINCDHAYQESIRGSTLTSWPRNRFGSGILVVFAGSIGPALLALEIILQLCNRFQEAVGSNSKSDPEMSRHVEDLTRKDRNPFIFGQQTREALRDAAMVLEKWKRDDPGLRLRPFY